MEGEDQQTRKAQ